MFNQQDYVNDYIKNNYKSIKVRVRNDNDLIIHYLNKVDNINSYILDLVKQDVYRHIRHNYINDEVTIDFELTNTMKSLIDQAEEADYQDDYGLYMNLAYAIDAEAKKEVSKHIITESDWNKLTRRYSL